jgi:ATP-dependent protease HslVU (ClpYQ) peptidase subunit
MGIDGRKLTYGKLVLAENAIDSTTVNMGQVPAAIAGGAYDFFRAESKSGGTAAAREDAIALVLKCKDCKTGQGAVRAGLSDSLTAQSSTIQARL